MVTITALNGQIPASMLVTIQGHLLRSDAAASLVRLSAAMEAAGYGPLLLSDGLSAYRSLADQRYMISIGLTTMPAGQSQHGEAVAGDFQGLGGYGAKRYAWLFKNGPAYGWSQPAWARAGGALPEPWHWEYNPDRDTHPTATPAQEADMPLNGDDINEIHGVVYRLWREPEIKAIIASAVTEAAGKAVAAVPVNRVPGSPTTWLQDTADGTSAALRIEAQVKALTAAVAAIKPGAPAAVTIDYAALAKAVNDDAARRMQA